MRATPGTSASSPSNSAIERRHRIGGSKRVTWRNDAVHVALALVGIDRGRLSIGTRPMLQQSRWLTNRGRGIPRCNIAVGLRLPRTIGAPLNQPKQPRTLVLRQPDRSRSVDFRGPRPVAKVLSAVTDAGYTVPTRSSSARSACLAGQGRLGIAQTGTGKTASFVLPMLTRLEKGRARARMPRTLILEPTRELAAQVEEKL